MTMRQGEGRRGFTLVELMIAIVLTGIVLGAMVRVLNGNQRYFRAQGEVTELQQNLRAVSLTLPAELREIAPAEGDIIEMLGTSLTIRAMRSFMVLCEDANDAAGSIKVRNSQTYAYRSFDANRDRILVFADNNVTLTSDDDWVDRGVTSSSSSSTCPDGGAATTYVLNGGAGALSGVYLGAPVRSYEQMRYRLYTDGGEGWLGVETFAGGLADAISPLAGPLQTANGITFTYYDASGVVTAVSTDVASIGITARGKTSREINVPGRPTGYYYDSTVVRTALRN